MFSSSRNTNSASSAQFRVRYTLHHTTALLLSLLWVQKSTKKTHLKSKTINYHMMREIEAQETQCVVRALKQFPVVSMVMRREIRYFVHLRTYTSRIRDGKIRYFFNSVQYKYSVQYKAAQTTIRDYFNPIMSAGKLSCGV